MTKTLVRNFAGGGVCSSIRTIGSLGVRFLVLAFSMTLAGCSNVETLNGVAQVAAEVQAAESQTPYATVEELDAITNGTTEYVYWRVARTFALMELESFRTENGWDGAKLSTLPVLVYDSMSRPKYYEYRVILDDREIGAITCVAQKRDGGPTAYVLPSPSDLLAGEDKGRGVSDRGERLSESCI